MIDSHVHLRDQALAYKETIKHGAELAYNAGFTALFDMPNTNPPLTSRENIVNRFKLAEESLQGLDIYYGLYGGITSDFAQIEEVVNCYNEFFPKMLGFKMFAGHSTGRMGITEKEEQRLVYKALAKLNYKGVLMVHCEKESLMNGELFRLDKPETHSQARPPIAELESIKDQLELVKSENFQGHLHICHISTKAGVDLVCEAKKQGMNISSGATSHHALLNDTAYTDLGLFAKMNPPLRKEDDRKAVFYALLSGKIDWLESDHAPHSLEDKAKGASGIPGFAGSLIFVQKLREAGCSQTRMEEICGGAVNKAFGLDLDYRVPSKIEIEKILPNLRDGYPFDAFSGIKV